MSETKDKTIKLSLIKKIFYEQEMVEEYDNFLIMVEAELKKEAEEKSIKKTEEERLERERPKEVYAIGVNVDESIGLERVFLKLFEDAHISDGFEDIEDEGVFGTELVLLNGKLYSVDYHCEAEWCGDWSLRCNLAGDFNILEFKEITDFELITVSNNYAEVKIK